MSIWWRKSELPLLVLYAVVFYVYVIRRSLNLSHDYFHQARGLVPGWIPNQFNDVSDAQWRNFRGNLPILTFVLGIFTMVANMLRAHYNLKAKGMSIVWLVISWIYLAYLHGALHHVSFCASFELDTPQKNFSLQKVAWYGFRWVMSLFLMELMTHFCYYNAFALSGLWKNLSPVDVFIIGYGVLNFMWLKFFLIWRYFRFWALVSGIETLENMPKCINNCYNLESFWKNWHASFNKWLVRYMYIPLGGSQRKLVNVWVIFTFVAIWHDLEWKLLSWAWLTCIFFIPEMIVKSAANTLKVESMFGVVIWHELQAVSGAITITCLMVANLIGFVIGPSGINWLSSVFFKREGLPVLGGLFLTFYVGTKLMIHISDAKQKRF
uniref:Membrane-bound O-acyltransferase C24H6.01c n=1 Tax=Daucus carota subsp. sativus TaxID=79200 RepID=A0A166DVZ5_DAUCS